MRVRLALSLALGVLVAAALRPAAGVAQSPAEPGFVVVRYDTGVSLDTVTLDGRAPSLDQQGYRKLAVPAGETADAFVARLRQDPAILSADRDAPVFAARTPDDPYYLTNQAQYLGPIGAPVAWDLATGTNTVVVAVLDSGIDVNHPEFGGRLWENSLETAGDGVDNDGNGCVDDRNGCRFVDYTPERGSACGYANSTTRTGAVADDNGRPGTQSVGSHGTLVSGIIGAGGNNGKGVAGVAWNVRIMPVKVLDCGVPSRGGEPAGEMSNVAAGIDYARRMGANIINLSLASRAGDTAADSPQLRAAIQAAQDQGIIIVAAAGNHVSAGEPVAPGYPAAYTQYPNVVAVGAADNYNDMTWASYSNYGPAIDFAAPGNRIVGPIRSDLGLSNLYGEAASGTSFAAPLVAGMFAVMMSRNSVLGAAAYIQIARDAATRPAAAPHGENWAGSGVINIGAAVRRVPMTITGNALKDWKDVPAGTEVRATIDGAPCGATTTASLGPIARYTLRVASDAEQPGCGAPGREVRITIAGQPATPTFTWGAPYDDLGLNGRDIVIVSPPPGAVVVQTLANGWSNVAHLGAAGPLPTAFTYLPPWESAYSWDPTKPAFDGRSGAYRRAFSDAPPFINDWTAVATYDTYWVYGTGGNIAVSNPNPPPGRVVSLKAGWNNFVYTGTSKAVADALSEVTGKFTQVLQYENPTGKWLSYLPGQPRFGQDFGGLFKLKVYWIYMTEAGSITMN